VDTKVRLLTNWPDASPGVVGLQGYASNIIVSTQGDQDFTAPLTGFVQAPIGANQRFIPLWTVQGSSLAIMEMEHGSNGLNISYSFEAFGYYWDRAVLDAPGGPRHPGAN